MKEIPPTKEQEEQQRLLGEAMMEIYQSDFEEQDRIDKKKEYFSKLIHK